MTTAAEGLARELEGRGIENSRVLAAIAAVPRHCFVPPELQAEAYADHPLPIGQGQTISQPYIVARMSCLLALRPEDRVLEIGTGSGYQTAILSLLAREVYTLERSPELSHGAQQTLDRLGFGNIRYGVGDGTLGWPEAAPFQAILVTAAAPRIPAPLAMQLTVGGRLVLPVGPRDNQHLVRLVRPAAGPSWNETLEPVRFVPLVGRYGWHEADIRE